MAKPSEKKPNILVIMGDDIGWFNPSIYHRGMMGYRTPNIDRIGNEGAMFTDWYGQQSCTAGRCGLHHRAVPIRTGLDQGRPAGRRHRHPGRGSDHRRDPQAAGLRVRAVRQEPPRRQERVPADRARLRRVLRQPLSPQRRGGARGPAIPEGSALQGEVRPARRAQVQGHRQGRSDRREALGRRRQADDRGHRPADQEADGDGGRGVRGRARSTSWTASAKAEQAVLLSTSTRPACTSGRT